MFFNFFFVHVLVWIRVDSTTVHTFLGAILILYSNINISVIYIITLNIKCWFKIYGYSLKKFGFINISEGMRVARGGE